MSSIKNSDLIITPATWNVQKLKLNKTATGLLDIVGWYGSIHLATMWRKDPQFLLPFEKMRIKGFNPQVTSWEPDYATIEAEVMAMASVVVIRLENNELLNGSLGSIAEIGLALTSAALRGQIIVVSIEDGLLTSLNEPGSIAQYMMLEIFLEQWENSPELAGLLHIHRGDNLHQLAQIACDAAHQQITNCQKSVNFEDFLTKKTRRTHNFPMRVLLGGSGGPYAKAHEGIFRRKKKAILAPYLSRGHAIKVLSEGAIADAWNIPYGSVDILGVALSTRTLLSIEGEYKRESDVLLLPIMAEAASKAAATEIGLLLLNALTTGQWLKIYLEPFDAVDYICHQLDEVDIARCVTEKQKRQALQEAGVGDIILASAVRDEVEETFNLFRGLMQGAPPSFGQVKKSLLGKTKTFRAADNIRRVRALVQAHLERLSSDQRFPGLFSYSTKIET